MRNVKLSLGVLMLLLFSTQARAQETPSVFSVGPMVGFGHAGLTNVSGVDAIFKPSYAAGLTATYSKMPHWGFGVDVFYSLEGGAFESSNTELDVTLHYVRVPLKVGYYFRDVNENFRPKITVGPSFGFLVDSKTRVETPSGSVSTGDVNSVYESWDVGVNAAIGFNLKLADNIWLNTDLGYYYGFIDVSGSDNNNMNLGLKVGVAFGL